VWGVRLALESRRHTTREGRRLGGTQEQTTPPQDSTRSSEVAMHPEKATRLYEQYELFPEMNVKKRRDDALRVLFGATGIVLFLLVIALA
jgi:hypothetical protein